MQPGTPDPSAPDPAAPDPSPGSARRRRTPLALAAVAVLAAVAFGLVVSRPTGGPRTLQAAAPSTTPGADQADTDWTGVGADDPASVVALVLDRSAAQQDRLATVVADGPDDPSALLRRIDDNAARAGVRADGSTFTTRWLEGDTALVDARLVLGGEIAGVDGVLLGSIQLERADGRWRVTAESLCGIARAGASLGLDARCGTAPTFSTTDGIAALGDVLGEAASTSPGTAIPLGVWGDPITRTGDVLWYVDYPEMRLGGGGPIGPAEVVAVDVGDGRILQRVLLEGTDAMLTPGDGDDVHVLHRVAPTDASGPWTTIVTRVDAVTGRGSDRRLTPETTWIATAPGGIWVFELARVGLLRDAEPTGSVDMVEVPGPTDPGTTATTDRELWATGPLGQPAVATVIDGRDGSVRRVDVPDGRLLGSGDRVWSLGTDDDGAPTARLLRADGSVERAVALPADLVRATGDWMDSWGDGTGGLWVTGRLQPLGGDFSTSMTLSVTEPVVAFHLGTDQRGDRSVWTRGSSPQGPSWFRSAGGSLAVSSGDEVALFEP